MSNKNIGISLRDLMKANGICLLSLNTADEDEDKYHFDYEEKNTVITVNF